MPLLSTSHCAGEPEATAGRRCAPSRPQDNSAASCRPTFRGALQPCASCLGLGTALLVPSPSTDPADPVPSVHTPTYLLAISRSKSAYTTDLFASIKPQLLHHKTLGPLVLARCPNSPPIHVSHAAAAQNLSAPNSTFQEAQDSAFFETGSPSPSKSVPPVPSILQVAPGTAPHCGDHAGLRAQGAFLLTAIHPSIHPRPWLGIGTLRAQCTPGGSSRARASPGRGHSCRLSRLIKVGLTAGSLHSS